MSVEKYEIVDYINKSFTVNKWEDNKEQYLNIFIDNNNTDIIDKIDNMCNIPHIVTLNDKMGGYNLIYTHINMVDMLSILYNDIVLYEEFDVSNDKLYEEYLKILNYQNDKLLVCLFRKTLPNAVIPSKKYASDAGYDLTIIKEVKKISKKTTIYDTGIQISTPPGFYTKIYARSSIVKSGYMITNNCGIIDSNYHGNIYIALTKIDDELPDLQLPFRCAQLILEVQHHFVMNETENEFDKNCRDCDGGIVRASK